MLPVVVLGTLALALAGLALWLGRGRAIALREYHAAREICDLGNDPVLVADILQGRILHANPAACDLLGYELPALLARKLPELHPAALLSRSAEVIADVWEKKGLMYEDLPFVRQDGELVQVECSANVIQFRSQPAFLIYARDIRERRLLEVQVRQLAEFPRNNPFPVFRLDDDGRVVYSNPAALRYLQEVGAGSEDLQAVLPTGFASRVRGAIDENRTVLNEQYEALGRVLTITYRPLPDSREVFAMVVDVTDRVRAEQKIRTYASDLEAAYRELRDTQAQLIQSEKMAALGNLVAGVAHELNTPIGAIHSNADVARRALEILTTVLTNPRVLELIPDRERVERAFKICLETNATNRDASQRVAAIVKSLRNFARLDEAERKKVDVHEGLDSTLTLLRHELKGRIQVVKDYGKLPEVDCFPNQLNQVFMNILVNGAQAMEGPGTLTMRTRVEPGWAVIELSDTGKGITPEHLGRIFDPGFTTKGVGVGTGLGLSISYRIIQDHKGTIDVQSELGKGTTFTLRLPIS